MRIKSIFLAALVLVLAFGMMIVGCESSTTANDEYTMWNVKLTDAHYTEAFGEPAPTEPVILTGTQDEIAEKYSIAGEKASYEYMGGDTGLSYSDVDSAFQEFVTRGDFSSGFKIQIMNELNSKGYVVIAAPYYTPGDIAVVGANIE